MNDSNQTEDYRELVEQLYHPRTRRAARQKLVIARAVEPLLDCLDSTNESVLWAAVESLGELRAAEAVEPLMDLLERGVLVVDVCEALTQITGKDCGVDVKRWRKAISDGQPPSTPAIPSAQECVRQTGDYLGVVPTGSGNSYRFVLSQPDGRSQKVAVFFGREDAKGDELVVIYSECGPIDPKHHELLLRKNMTIPAGAFAIRDIDGKPQVVMVDTMVAATVTPSALAKKIENIAVRADAVEKSVTKEDRR